MRKTFFAAIALVLFSSAVHGQSSVSIPESKIRARGFCIEVSLSLRDEGILLTKDISSRMLP
jgi:hypothetical protein